MNNQQPRQMPPQVQKSLREASIRSMLIQRQLAEARQHLPVTPQMRPATQLPVVIQQPNSNRFGFAEIEKLKELLSHTA